MALRNYIYAKHSKDMVNVAVDNVDAQELKQKIIASREKRKEERLKVRQRKKLQNVMNNSCGSGRELIMEDGSKICRNCTDCSKQTSTHQKDLLENGVNIVQPKISIELQSNLSNEEYDTTIDKLENTHIDSGLFEVDFTNSFKKADS